MDSRILEIVFCLMDYAQEADDQIEDISEYSDNLKNLGYTEPEIFAAYNWILDHIGSPSESLYSLFPEQVTSSRILTELERARLTTEAHGFLLKLVNSGVLSGEELEAVLDRLTMSGQRAVTSDQVRLVVSAVMFNQYRDADRGLLSEFSSDSSSYIN